jgi:hypothetical protein
MNLPLSALVCATVIRKPRDLPDHFLAQRVAIESEVAKLEILLHNVSGEKRQALHKAWSYRKSVPGQVESGIIALVLYAVLPPMVFNRLKKFYRSLVPRD